MISLVLLSRIEDLVAFNLGYVLVYFKVHNHFLGEFFEVRIKIKMFYDEINFGSR